MVKLFLFCVAITLANSSFAQWKATYGNAPVISYGVHEGILFIGKNPLTGLDALISKYNQPQNWTDAAAGVDRKQGVVTTFASLGRFFFAGMSQYSNNLEVGPGPAWRSSDGGRHWVASAGGCVASNGHHVFCVGDGIYRSLDSGENWSKLTSFEPRSIIAFNNYVIADSSGSICRSSDSGVSWQRVYSPEGGIRSFTFANSMLYGINGRPWVSEGSLMRSVDSGAHWEMITTPSFHVQSIVSDGKHLFAGGLDGLFVLDSDGATWLNKTDTLDTHRIVSMGVFDTLLFVDVSTGSSSSGCILYSRSIPAMFPNEQRATVSQVATKDTISIYPNPTLSSVRIDFGSAAVRRVEVLDVLGASKQVLAPRESSLTLDLAPLPSGTYFLRFETEKGIHMRKIVKE